MKRLLSVFVALTFTLLSAAQQYDVYLCIGQSNMAGRGKMLPRDKEPIEGVFLLGPDDTPVPATGNANIYSTIRKNARMQGYNLSIPFASKMYAQTGRPVLLVVNARGGTMLDQWVKDAPCYTFNNREGDDPEKVGGQIPQFYAEAVRRAKAAMKYGTLKGILWHQGEGDRSQALRDTYIERIEKMVSDLRSDLGVGEEVRFVLGDTYHYGIGAPVNPTLSQIGYFVPNSFWASADGCAANPDNLHFSREGLVLLGERYAEAMLSEQQPFRYVKARNPFLHQWIMYPSVTLAEYSLTPRKEDKTDAFGGLKKGPRFDATGFFRTDKYNGRWVMVDPQGRMFIDAGLTHIITGGGEEHKAAYSKKYSDWSEWIGSVASVLQSGGFNGSGAWSAIDTIRMYNARNPKNRITYYGFIGAMRGYKAKVDKMYASVPEHPHQHSIPVFDPEFKEFCQQRVEEVAGKLKDDPDMIAYFTDNELGFSLENLEGNLELPEDFPSRIAAEKWLSDRALSKEQITDKERHEFVGHVAETYYSIVGDILKSQDPNHLNAGSRLHDTAKFIKEVVEAAGRHCDIVSYNYYTDWCVRPEEIKDWDAWSGKPFLITEFYTKGEDSGLANTRGAGWRVPTQQDRHDFYQNFVLQLLLSDSCVGWQWFKYQDNDPTDKTLDPTNIDANKGVVDNSYNPYGLLLDGMRRINARRYGIILQGK